MRRRSLSKFAATSIALAAFGVFAPACKKKPSAASVVVGAAGGTIASGDGAVKLVIPPGALASDTTIGLKPRATTGADADLIPGTAWDFTPSGTYFAQPVQVALRWDPSLVPHGTDSSRLALVHLLDDGTRMIADGLSMDLSAHLATGTLNSFSGVSLIGCPVPCPVAPPVLGVTYQGMGVMRLTFNVTTPLLHIQRAFADSGGCQGNFFPDGYRVCEASFTELALDRNPGTGFYQDIYQMGITVLNYRIKACTDAVNCSPWSTIIHVVDSYGTGGGPALTLAAAAVSTTEIDLSWTPLIGIDHYELEAATGGPSGYTLPEGGAANLRGSSY